MRLQREVPGIEEAHECAGDIPLECLRAARQEERVVLSPYGQKGRLAVAEILLEGRVKRDVALVITEKIELRLIRTGTGQVEVIERVAVGRNPRRVGDTVSVLPDGGLGFEKGAQRVAIFLR